MDMCACLHPLTCYFFVCGRASMHVCVCVLYCTVLYGGPDTDYCWASDALAMARDGLVWNK